tara:strand:- start:78 stop:767 length:690 start_codon:yes stop_codon:yes gene_type:complete
MKILVACETSGTVRNAFLEKGHDVWSCDVLPSDDQTNRHIQDDVRNVLAMESWDMMMVAHPPCTRLCNSGVRWLSKAPVGKTVSQMWDELRDGCSLFSDLWNADVPRIAVENPVMHRHAKKIIGEIQGRTFEDKTQVVHPWEFGTDENGPDNVSKQTCLWLKGLPKLKTNLDLNVPGRLDGTTKRHDIHNATPGPDRWKIRSKFFPGMAKAMADQWGTLPETIKYRRVA